MQFGLLYFSSGEETQLQDKYRLVLEGARFADQHGFSAVWVPERHFTQVGCLYPNPAVVQAAVARETKQIALRAGSVVLPLHHPIRVAEEWAVVDNLSNGRVGLSFASGWHPDDFVLAPDKYKDRGEEMYRGIEIVKKLWQGGSVRAKGGDGKEVDIKVYPTPIQKDVPIWLTAAGNPKTFARAGEMGAHLLTHLFNQGIDETKEKIAIYRQARARAGLDPNTGKVAVMMHTFVGPDLNTVREQVRGPFGNYLKSSADLLKAIAFSQGQNLDINKMSEKDREYLINFVFERLFNSRVLFGTPQSCLPIIEKLRSIGVDEIACQIDFGIETDLLLASLPYLNELKELCQPLPSANRNPLDAIRNRCPKETASDELRRQGIERVLHGNGEALAELRLPEAANGEATASRLRSALMDLCFRTLRAATDSESTFAPAGMRGVRTHGKPEPRMWGHIVLKGSKNDIPEGDIRILSDSGELVMEAQGLRLKRTQSCQPAAPARDWKQYADWFYELQWQPKAFATSERGCVSAPCAGHWLILGEGHGIGRELAALLFDRGDSCTVIDADCLDEILPSDGSLKGIIHLGSLDAADANATTPQTLEIARHLGSTSVVNVLQKLASGVGQAFQPDSANAESPRLWIVTRGAQGIGSEAVPGIAQSPVWGLGRMIPVELAQFWGGLVDLDPNASADDSARQLLDTVNDPEREDQVAFRDGKRLAARLVRKKQAPASGVALAPRGLTPDGAYLITGGLGGIGLRLARWLASEGARHLVLLGRGNPQAEAIAAIAELQSKGVRIHVVAADVADETRMAEVLQSLRREGCPAIRGVMHAAGLGLDRTIVDMDDELLSQVFRAKVAGSWVLHRLLHEEPLDFFALFSSANSLLAMAGQGSYAAANAFLDALAHHRRAEGKPALCINWGPWGEVGFGATAQGVRQHSLLALQGITRLAPQQGIDVLKLMMQHNVTQIVAIPIDWPKLLHAHSAIVDWPLLSALPELGLAATRSGARTSLARRANVSQSRQRGRVMPRNELEQAILNMWREVLKSDAIGVFDNFFELGGQSIQGAVLVNKLQEKLGEVVHIASLFDAPTIADLAVYLQDHYPAGVAKLLGKETAEANGRHEPADTIDEAKISHFEKVLHASMAQWQRPIRVEGKNPSAVFVLSPPRSGSTLLRVMLAGHPALFAPPELELLTFTTLEDRKNAMSGRNSYRLQGALRAVMEARGCDGEEAARIVDRCEREGWTTQRFYQLLQESVGSRRLVDKTPSYALSEEILRRAEDYFEDVFYIHLLRHPRGMIQSFEDAHMEALFHDMDNGCTPRQLAEIVWTQNQRNILRFLKTIPAHRQCQVRYEDLVERPEPVMRELCRNLGLEFHAGVLKPYEDKQKRMTDGVQMFGDVKFHTHQGINAQMAHRWKENGGGDFLGDVTWKMAESLGYRREENCCHNGKGRTYEKNEWTIAPMTDKDESLDRLNQASDAEVDALLQNLLAQEENKR